MHADIRILLRGLGEASQRIEEAKLERDPDAMFIAMFNGLNWIVSIHEWISSSDDRARWDARPEFLDLLRALRFARNRVHHQWATALVPEDGTSFPLKFPAAFITWMWLPRAELPLAERPDDAGADAYDRHLAGKDVALAISDVQSAFLMEGVQRTDGI